MCDSVLDIFPIKLYVYVMLCYEECKQKFILCKAYIEGHQLLGLCQCAAMLLCRDTSDDITK